jgi:hypothetical protein
VEELDVLAARLGEGAWPTSGEDCLHGRDGWLFERAGAHRVSAQMRGDLLLSRKAALRWVFVLEARAAWLADRGAAYVFGVAPCKWAVMAEHLPRGVVVAPQRPIAQLQRWIAEDESFAPLVYPLEELRAAAATFDPQGRGWNAHGAFVAYRALLAQVPPAAEMRRVERADEPRTARLVSDNGVAGEGRMLVTECESAPAATCVVFGDRPAYLLLPYLAESFRRMVLVELGVLDHEMVEAERPGLVITVADEASLIDVPADIEAPRAHELAARALPGGAG